MSRSAADATRFTATSPHAYAKHTPLRSSASNASSSPQSHFLPRKMQPPTPTSPNGSTETPAQKVARLRRAHDAQKLSQVTRWEKIQVTGRRWADRAHRFTILSLIGLTGTYRIALINLFVAWDLMLLFRRRCSRRSNGFLPR